MHCILPRSQFKLHFLNTCVYWMKCECSLLELESCNICVIYLRYYTGNSEQQHRYWLKDELKAPFRKEIVVNVVLCISRQRFFQDDHVLQTRVQIHTWISKLVLARRFWKNLHQVRSRSKDFKAKHFKVVGGIKPKSINTRDK